MTVTQHQIGLRPAQYEQKHPELEGKYPFTATYRAMLLPPMANCWRLVQKKRWSTSNVTQRGGSSHRRALPLVRSEKHMSDGESNDVWLAREGRGTLGPIYCEIDPQFQLMMVLAYSMRPAACHRTPPTLRIIPYGDFLPQPAWLDAKHPQAGRGEGLERTYEPFSQQGTSKFFMPWEKTLGALNGISLIQITG